MAWDWDIYGEFRAHGRTFENPLATYVHIDATTNNGANILALYSGTFIIEKLLDLDNVFEEFDQPSGRWARGQVQFMVPTPDRVWQFLPLEGLVDNRPNVPNVPAAFQRTYFHSGTVHVSLASISNDHVANNAGWAIDGADVHALGFEDEGIRVQAKVAVRDSDGRLQRVSYQVAALGQDWPTVLGGISPGAAS